jgi:hypothetical protein
MGDVMRRILNGLALVVAVLSLDGCSLHREHIINDPAVITVDFASIPVQTQFLIRAVSSLYGEEDPKDISVMKTFTEDQKPMYLVSLRGRFRKGSLPPDQKIQATRLRFSVLEDASKVWALVALDDAGRTVWKQDNFSVKNRNVTYTGRSQHWKGEYHFIDSRVFTDINNYLETGGWMTSNFVATYTGDSRDAIGPFKFSLGSGGCSVSGPDFPSSRTIACGGPGLDPGPDGVLTAHFEWGNHYIESFVLTKSNPGN